MTKTTKGNKKNRKGFSLLELVVVVAILGIIATAVMVNAGQFTYPAKVNMWKTSMESLKNSLLIYASTHSGGFPTATVGAEVEVNEWLGNSGAYFLDKPIENPFNANIPVKICGKDGTNIENVKPDVSVDKAKNSDDCVLAYAVLDFPDPVSGLTIPNGRMILVYQIGTDTATIIAP